MSSGVSEKTHFTGGPGPFVTHRLLRLPSGAHLVATSRRHRKGLRSHAVGVREQATQPRVSSAAAFGHFLAPTRLGWWIALLFAIGSCHFLAASLAATWPGSAPAASRDVRTLGWIFFVGSVFFTSAAWLQWLEALNGDVADAFEGVSPRWRWFGFRPQNLGYLACTVQLAGTVFFNFNTWDAMRSDLSWRQEDLLVWTPGMLGSVCFLLASYLAYSEVSHGVASLAPRSIGWWIAVLNLLGSVAFQISALDSFAAPEPASPERLFRSTLWTAVGAACFLGGAYLLVPELFDDEGPDVGDPEAPVL